ncbi:Gfo/Idh/MocA family oxidoreductase [Balneolaceae bacterium ANBcel3]|nr:Gfo/Idh/MocA family oxidoreductase [Balneolaceae bacterium ANBcel3]
MKDNSFTTNRGISRRDFVKASTITAGGLLLSSLPVGASAFAAGSETLKVALIGAGGRGTGAAFDAIRAGDGIKIVAVADLFQDRLDSCMSQLEQAFGGTDKLDVPQERRFVGFNAYKKATAEADIVLLCAPPGFRPDHYEEAVRQGKHVFMEKPVATDAPGIRRVLEAGEIAKQKGLNVVVGLQRRYQNNYREIVRRIRDGQVGEILGGQVYWNQGDIWVNNRQPGQSELEYQMRNWYYFNWVCGDHNVEQHIHNIDVASWFLNENPISAQGMGGREVRTGKEHGQIFDHHFVEYTYPSGARIASQCRQIPNTFGRVAEDFQATGGFLFTDGAHNATIHDRQKNLKYNHDGMDDPSPYQQEIIELVESIRKGTVIDDTRIGAEATLSAIMGRMATYTGQVITWDQAMNSQEQLVPKNMDWDTPPPVTPDENGYYPVPVPGRTPVI